MDRRKFISSGLIGAGLLSRPSAAQSQTTTAPACRAADPRLFLSFPCQLRPEDTMPHDLCVYRLPRQEIEGVAKSVLEFVKSAGLPAYLHAQTAAALAVTAANVRSVALE